MAKGRSGERYTLGGVNASYIKFFDLLAQTTGKKNSLIKLPVWAMMFAGNAIQVYSVITGRAPLLTPPWIKKYYYDWSVSSEKAQEELGYNFISLEQGLQKTVDWIRNNKQ
jgi:farnesol dehydrogenase